MLFRRSGTSQSYPAQNMTMRDNRKKALELYKEIDLVEKAIQNQIVETIDKRYVKTLIGRTTHTI